MTTSTKIETKVETNEDHWGNPWISAEIEATTREDKGPDRYSPAIHSNTLDVSLMTSMAFEDSVSFKLRATEYNSVSKTRIYGLLDHRFTRAELAVIVEALTQFLALPTETETTL